MKNNIVKTDNELVKYIKEVGESNFKKCFQCGTCSAVCPLSTEDRPFPRKEMILAGWGLKEELVSDLDPWLCYYCGECSKNCPRKAEPGELMMSLRRFLISAYDWTGISKILYKSKYAEYIAIYSAYLYLYKIFDIPVQSYALIKNRRRDIINSPGSAFLGQFLEHSPQ